MVYEGIVAQNVFRTMERWTNFCYVCNVSNRDVKHKERKLYLSRSFLKNIKHILKHNNCVFNQQRIYNSVEKY